MKELVLNTTRLLTIAILVFNLANAASAQCNVGQVQQQLTTAQLVQQQAAIAAFPQTRIAAPLPQNFANYTPTENTAALARNYAPADPRFVSVERYSNRVRPSLATTLQSMAPLAQQFVGGGKQLQPLQAPIQAPIQAPLKEQYQPPAAYSAPMYQYQYAQPQMLASPLLVAAPVSAGFTTATATAGSPVALQSQLVAAPLVQDQFVTAAPVNAVAVRGGCCKTGLFHRRGTVTKSVAITRTRG